ncbi:YrrS family protein [Bacillus sp. 03113]|uniref:YrrS family protein n=1 Tax=Bacillus sp. 03113 TaxID=2578211 RepID=UPI001144AE90|nr:YrrS family protein [Bacillus sp. 03113]
MNEEINRSSRTAKRSKRRKTNLILNGLIAIVVILIIFVTVKIFFSGETAAPNVKQPAIEKETDAKNENKKANEASAGVKEKDHKSQSDQLDDNDSKQETSEEPIITEGGSDSSVIRTIENPSWKPVGTTQTGEHATLYETGTVDWDEMLNALSYATGIEKGNMTVVYIGNNNHDPQKAIGTVSTKDKQEKYRVYIEWIDGKGWKPSKVEELNAINIR